MADRLVIPVEVRMSDYGYWVVTMSVSPTQRFSVMIVRQGISAGQAIEAAFATVDQAIPPGGHA